MEGRWASAEGCCRSLLARSPLPGHRDRSTCMRRSSRAAAAGTRGRRSGHVSRRNTTPRRCHVSAGASYVSSARIHTPAPSCDVWMMHTGGVVDWPAKSTDAELLVAAGRDPNAFGGLYDRHAASVLRWALRSGLSEADALDLVSEVFARAWIHRRRFHDPGDGNAAPWLFGIARHLLASHRRSGRIEQRARRRLRIPLPEADHSEAVVDRIDARAKREALDRALAGLPRSHASAVRLRVIEGLGYPDIASQLGCTEPTARKWVSLGLRSLRTTMEVSS
jgi:RNA polymerase sigma factor (sigma-70 family)